MKIHPTEEYSHRETRLEEARALELLLLCARRQIGGDFAGQTPPTVAAPPEWDALVATANGHGLIPVLSRNVEACMGEPLPSQWKELFRQEYLHNSCRNLALTAELFRVLDAFESRGVSGVPYKGPVLAVQAYGDVALREFSDLDILVPQRQITKAHAALLSLGFEPVTSGLDVSESPRQIPGQYAYRKGATLVELHTERTLRYFPRPLVLDELHERRQSVTILNRQLPAFSPEDTLLLLCVHGSKHLWERLGWIADIAALTERSGLDWVRALDRAQKWRIQRMALLGAGLATQLFDMHLPTEIITCLKRDRTGGRLIDEISHRLFSPRRVQLGVLSRFAFRVRMRGALFEGLPYALRLALLPTEDDRAPKSYLAFCYAALRPLRLARAYGWRTRVDR